MQASRADVLGYRVDAQQVDSSGEHPDAAVLDLGVQDTGREGAPWVLALGGPAPAWPWVRAARTPR
ncbi:MAG: hypothetical protein WB441_09695 [Nocardioidaceae bacterium]